MNGLGQEEVTEMMGIGSYVGEVRMGPDGAAYQWVQGVDGLGNPFGFWKQLRRLARRVQPFIRKALPIAQKFAPFIPGYGPVISQGLRIATPWLQRAGIAGGLGELYEASDGTVYEMSGLEQDDELQGLGAEDLPEMMGVGNYLGEVRIGPDGAPYEWMQGVDGLGNPVGFWKKLRRFVRRTGRFIRKAIPIAQTIAPFIPVVGPAVAAGIRTATPILKCVGIAEDGMGELYEADDGNVYRVDGLAREEDLEGVGQEGASEYPEAAVDGLDQCYARDGQTAGVDAYVPATAADTRWCAPSSGLPENWKPLF